MSQWVMIIMPAEDLLIISVSSVKLVILFGMVLGWGIGIPGEMTEYAVTIDGQTIFFEKDGMVYYPDSLRGKNKSRWLK